MQHSQVLVANINSLGTSRFHSSSLYTSPRVHARLSMRAKALCGVGMALFSLAGCATQRSDSANASLAASPGMLQPAQDLAPALAPTPAPTPALAPAPARPARPAPKPAGPRPDAEAVSKEQIEQAVRDGVAHLIKIQSTMERGEDAATREWPYEGVYRVAGQIPEGYRVGGTAICALALIDAPGYADDAPRKEAVAKATAFICDGTKISLLSPETYDGGYDVRQWAYIYSIQYLSTMKGSVGFPAGQEAACEAAIKWYLNALQTTEIPKEGGWNYARRGPKADPSAPSSFMTGTALQALFEAKKQGYDVDPGVVDRALAFLEKTRYASGAVAYSGTSGERFGTGSATPGAVGRMLVVESTLVLAGRGEVAKVRGALDAFIVHWDWLKVRKQQPGTHVAPFGVAPYYFMFAHRYAAQAIELLPAAERPEYRRRVNNLLFSVREEEDGSWNDRVFARSSGYGTAMAMLGMLDSTTTPPARWEAKAE